ncbi:hypothetical protein QVN42_03920 [Yersinia nurmii]|uniref:Uncharacterized protein n=1 Tax=Yersinia nurmii TaxID=685706 RepID=A0AAW7K790_9GAMM|nr:hypothetical protein [Yersinia nurmii]MDN0086550.1 hypothetical protein [Yersinia nurmii]
MWSLKVPVITYVSKMATESPRGNQENSVATRCININNATQSSPAILSKSYSAETRTDAKTTTPIKNKGYIYCPFFNDEMIKIAFSMNSTRMLQGKEPYGILSPDPTKLFNEGLYYYLLKKRDSIIEADEFISGCDKKLFIDKYFNKDSMDVMYSENCNNLHKLGQYLLYDRTKYFSLSTVKASEIGKIYICGHGCAGSEHIVSYQDGKKFVKTAKEIVAELADLLKRQAENKIDIRLRLCESADSKSARNLDEQYLAARATTQGNKKSLAQHMSDALQERGLTAKVFGYHGLGIISNHRSVHGIRAIKSDFESNRGDNSYKIYRASQYRKEFHPYQKTPATGE